MGYPVQVLIAIGLAMFVAFTIGPMLVAVMFVLNDCANPDSRALPSQTTKPLEKDLDEFMKRMP